MPVDEDAVSEVMAVTGAGREDALKALSMAGGDTNEAAAIILDGRLNDDDLAKLAQADEHDREWGHVKMATRLLIPIFCVSIGISTNAETRHRLGLFKDVTLPQDPTTCGSMGQNPESESSPGQWYHTCQKGMFKSEIDAKCAAYSMKSSHWATSDPNLDMERLLAAVFRHQPPLRDFDAKEFLSLIAEKSALASLVFVGDSISRDFYMQLGCGLSAFPGVERVKQRMGWGDGGAHGREIFAMEGFNTTVQLVYPPIMDHFNEQRFEELLTTFPGAIFLVNFGAHFRPMGPYNHLSKNVTQWADKALEHRGNTAGRSHFIWREIAAQHFAFSLDFKEGCLPWNLDAADLQGAGNARTLKQLLRKHETYKIIQERNVAATNQIVEQRGIPILHTFEMSKSVYWMHRTSRKDCTHWWLPSGVYFAWAQSLVSILEGLPA